MGSIEDVFRELVVSRNQAASVSLGGIHKDVFADMGLTFDNADALTLWTTMRR
jgi:hypothetical protein